MVFSSLVFLSVFLPIVFLLYLIIPSIRWKNALLVVASLLFYAYGEPIYVCLMIISALLNYLFGRMVEQGRKGRKFWVTAAVVVNLGILGVFKYTGFLVENINRIAGMEIPVPQIVLPIGISFFTFQALSYVIDVYRESTDAQKSFWKLLLYISFFPQLIAGPIVKYHDIAQEIENRTQTVEGVAEGLRRFIIGLSKKVLIANTMGQAADYIFGLDMAGVNILGAWIGALAYAMQIYYDFSGYSDMAIGLGRMFGFHFKENFHYPYAADSMQDFWRRWHISLSTWFKEYLYIPLGGNRRSRARVSFNKLVVFFSTGLWHGASWTFVVWGLLHGAFLLLEDTILPVKKLKCLWLRRLYAAVTAIALFVIFRAETLTQGFAMIGKMFTGFSFDALSVSNSMAVLNPMFVTVLILGMIFAMPVKEWVERKIAGKGTLVAVAEPLSYLLSMVLLVLCVMNLSAASYNPFIYFRF